MADTCKPFSYVLTTANGDVLRLPLLSNEQIRDRLIESIAGTERVRDLSLSGIDVVTEEAVYVVTPWSDWQEALSRLAEVYTSKAGMEKRWYVFGRSLPYREDILEAAEALGIVVFEDHLFAERPIEREFAWVYDPSKLNPECRSRFILREKDE